MSDPRIQFEKIHCGGNKQTCRRNEVGDYVLPSIQDAWSGWLRAWETLTSSSSPSAEPLPDERERFEGWRNSQEDDHAAAGDACRRSEVAGVYHWESVEKEWQAWQAACQQPSPPPSDALREALTDEQILALAEKNESREVLGPAKRVSIAELEALLASDDPPKVEIQPDGLSRIAEAPAFRFRFTEPHLLAFSRALLAAPSAGSAGQADENDASWYSAIDSKERAAGFLRNLAWRLRNNKPWDTPDTMVAALGSVADILTQAVDQQASEWKIEYDNDTGPTDESFHEWWTVTDGELSFKCVTQETAEWLLRSLAHPETPNKEPE